MPYIGAPIVTTTFVLDQFTATAGQTGFTLSQAPASAQSVVVGIDGVVQEPNQAYTVSGTTLTFTSGVPLNSRVFVIHLGVRSTLQVPADGSVGSTSFAAAARPVVGVGRNISGRTDATTPNSKININADELMLKDSSGNVFIATAFSLTADITASGANGLDTGAEASNTWYYGWVIAKTDGTVASLISASNTAPTLPAGYTFKALASAVRNDGSSNFIPYRQFGTRAFFETMQNILNAGVATTETSVTYSGFVPPNAQDYELRCRARVASQTTASDYACNIRVVSGSTFYTQEVSCASASAFGTTASSVLVPNTGNLFYLNSTGISLNLDVQGFKLPGGGE